MHAVGNLSWHVCIYMCLYGRVRWPGLGAVPVWYRSTLGRKCFLCLQIYLGPKVRMLIFPFLTLDTW